MRAISAGELTRMRATQGESMQDTCVVQTISSSVNSYGETVASYTDGSAIACGLEMGESKERERADGTRTVIDARLRTPIGTAVTVLDRVKVTKRNGTTLSTALVFEVVGYPQRGPSALVMELKAVS